MVIENQYIQTSLMVALTLFRGKEGGPIDKSEVNIVLVYQRVMSNLEVAWSQADGFMMIYNI